MTRARIEFRLDYAAKGKPDVRLNISFTVPAAAGRSTTIPGSICWTTSGFTSRTNVSYAANMSRSTRAARCTPTASHRYRTSNYLLYGFLTTEPNGVVAPIHPKAMPVILTTREECDVWMRASRDESGKLLQCGTLHKLERAPQSLLARPSGNGYHPHLAHLINRQKLWIGFFQLPNAQRRSKILTCGLPPVRAARR
jgi:hypothetical protein